MFTTPYTTKMSKYKYHIDQYMFFLPNELYTFAKKKKKKLKNCFARFLSFFETEILSKLCFIYCSNYLYFFLTLGFEKKT